MLRMLIILAIFLVSNESIGQVAVIANKSVLVDEIDQTELADFYTGELSTWGDGEPVVMFDLKPKTEVKETFYRYIGKSTSRLKSIWLRRKLSGEGDPPEALETEADVLERVASTVGSIGFVSLAVAQDSTVKVLVLIQ